MPRYLYNWLRRLEPFVIEFDFYWTIFFFSYGV